MQLHVKSFQSVRVPTSPIHTDTALYTKKAYGTDKDGFIIIGTRLGEEECYDANWYELTIESLSIPQGAEVIEDRLFFTTTLPGSLCVNGAQGGRSLWMPLSQVQEGFVVGIEDLSYSNTPTAQSNETSEGDSFLDGLVCEIKKVNVEDSFYYRPVTDMEACFVNRVLVRNIDNGHL